VNRSGRAEGPSPTPDLVFWPGGLGSLGFAAVLEAAATGGFTRMAISPLMIHQLLATGSTAGIIAHAHQSGVTLSDLDGVASWAPLWHEDNPMPWIRERFNFTSAQRLDMASATGLTSVLVAGAFDRGALDIDTLTEHFGAFCDDAAARDIRVEWRPFRIGASPSCRWPGKSYAVQADPTAGWSSPPGTCRRARPTSSETWNCSSRYRPIASRTSRSPMRCSLRRRTRSTPNVVQPLSR
jgi:hypothetical protein